MSDLGFPPWPDGTAAPFSEANTAVTHPMSRPGATDGSQQRVGGLGSGAHHGQWVRLSGPRTCDGWTLRALSERVPDALDRSRESEAGEALQVSRL